MMESTKVTPDHLRREAYLYIRQSSLHQVQENRESTARQYDLRRRAMALGWNTDQVVVIDDDLGLSGASAAHRGGFQRLVADVGLGRVGVVMGLEVSRLARNSTDWHKLLEICALSETLILDEDGVYDPSHFNDRLLLGLKGTMSEAELHVLKARLIGGLMNKARRGELWMRPPLGFIYDARKRMVLDPDQQIQEALQTLFDTFQKTGSAQRVVRHFATHGLLFPFRIHSGPRTGDVMFVRLAHSRVLNILHNPRYAGAYVFGRSRQRKIVVPGQMRHRKLPRPEWKVFLPNATPGYISWEQFEINQAKLLENAAGYGPDRRKSPAREGGALLQGLVICGMCGKRMTVRYDTCDGRSLPLYVCQRRGIEYAQPACQILRGAGLDGAVAHVVLESVTPASLDVALEVFQELKARKAEVDRLRLLQVQRAREDANLAEKQYRLARPENRLVVDTLEREWNQRLQRLNQVEEEYAQAVKSQTHTMDPDIRERIQALASDLPKVWNDPKTPMRDKKRMLRLLVEDVTLRRADQTIRLDIRWKGGATSTLDCPTPKSGGDLRRTPSEVVEQVRALATEQTDKEIAQTLNARHLRSGMGKPFHRLMIKMLRRAYKIDSLTDHLRRQGWLTVPEAAVQLGLHHGTAKRFAREGVLPARRSDDKDTILFAPLTGPLPKAHPGKRFRDRRQYEPLGSKRASKEMKGVQYAG